MITRISAFVVHASTDVGIIHVIVGARSRSRSGRSDVVWMNGWSEMGRQPRPAWMEGRTSGTRLEIGKL